MERREPTKMQKEAIDCRGKVVLKSCPGSGKTYVVAEKMIKEISEWKEKNRGIALLSFTNVASEEVSNRIKELSGISNIGYPHYVGTLDSFISKYLYLPFGHLIMQCEKRPKIIQEESLDTSNYIKGIGTEVCHRNQCNIKDFFIDENDKLQDVKGNFNKCTKKGKKPCETVKRKMISQGLGTYMDMTMIAIKILRDYPNIGKLLAKRFPTMIIDEAQDTSKYQMQLIDLLVGYGIENIMLVGDSDQAIYEWRNADPSVFLDKYNNGANGWNSKLLNDNFRCSQKICNVTKVFSTLTNISTACGEDKDCTLKPEVFFYDKDNKQEVINYFINKCRENSIETSSEKIVVLSRGRTGLTGKDYSRIQNLWQSPGASLFSEAAFERDYGSIKRAIKLVKKGLKYYFFDSSNDFINLKDEDIEKNLGSINLWNKIVFQFCKDMPSADIPLNQWKKDTIKVIEDISKKYTLSAQENSEIKIKTRDNTYKDFKEQPIKNFFIKNYETDNYLNSTIHSVKGRTFEAVLLILETNGKLTTKMLNTNPIESEEIRTGYVAMTRAKKLLMVAVPKTVKPETLKRFPKGEWQYTNISEKQ